MHTKRELDQRIADAGIRPLKKLGQNFLLNPKICSQIVEAAVQFSPKTVVEIGPGLGALTDDLAGKSYSLILVELDSGLAHYWQKKGCQVLHEDALKLNFSEVVKEKPAVLVSNLPYSIAASLIVELSSRNQPFVALILMFQKEVAQRIEALPNSEDYGMLSVLAQSAWDIKKVIDAGPQDFYPVPNVGSRVLCFLPRPHSPSDEKFLKFVKLAFSQRRKKTRVKPLQSIR